jgi:hypothetical protein
MSREKDAVVRRGARLKHVLVAGGVALAAASSGAQTDSPKGSKDGNESTTGERDQGPNGSAGSSGSSDGGRSTAQKSGHKTNEADGSTGSSDGGQSTNKESDQGPSGSASGGGGAAGW